MTRAKANESDKILGLKIRALRNSIGVSGKWLGDKIGVSPQQIMKYEKGSNRVSLTNIKIIADTFNKPLSYFNDDYESSGFANIVDNTILKIWRNLIKLKNVDHQKAVNSLIKALLKGGSI